VESNCLETSEYATNSYVKRKDYGAIMNQLDAHHLKNVQEPTPPLHGVQDKPMINQNLNYMPTIINGQINSTKKDNGNEINNMNSKCDHLRNLVKESEVKLLDNKERYLSIINTEFY
jgi:hypothetical protein